MPTIDPFVIATGEVTATRSVLVRARILAGAPGSVARTTSEGIGEGACLPPVTREDQPDALSAVRRAIPILEGREFADLQELESVLDSALIDSPVARSAVEVSVLDALARYARLPLHAWLSGRIDPRPAKLTTDMTLPILSHARMVELARDWAAKGFLSLKMKIGRELDHDLRVLAAVHEAVPSATFRPDANTALTPDEAVRFVNEAASMGAVIECFEQPCGSLEQLAEVAARIAPPVIADESVKSLADLDAILAMNAADGVNLKVAKTGSLLRAYAIGRRAKERGLVVMVGGMVETRLGMTTAAHLAAAISADFNDLDTAWLLREEPFEGGYLADGPEYTLPWVPGLGVSHNR